MRAERGHRISSDSTVLASTARRLLLAHCEGDAVSSGPSAALYVSDDGPRSQTRGDGGRARAGEHRLVRDERARRALARPARTRAQPAADRRRLVRGRDVLPDARDGDPGGEPRRADRHVPLGDRALSWCCHGHVLRAERTRIRLSRRAHAAFSAPTEVPTSRSRVTPALVERAQHPDLHRPEARSAGEQECGSRWATAHVLTSTPAGPISASIGEVDSSDTARTPRAAGASGRQPAGWHRTAQPRIQARRRRRRRREMGTEQHARECDTRYVP